MVQVELLYLCAITAKGNQSPFYWPKPKSSPKSSQFEPEPETYEEEPHEGGEEEVVSISDTSPAISPRDMPQDQQFLSNEAYWWTARPHPVYAK